jgi:hypothetical protein
MQNMHKIIYSAAFISTVKEMRSREGNRRVLPEFYMAK